MARDSSQGVLSSAYDRIRDIMPDPEDNPEVDTDDDDRTDAEPAAAGTTEPDADADADADLADHEDSSHERHTDADATLDRESAEAETETATDGERGGTRMRNDGFVTISGGPADIDGVDPGGTVVVPEGTVAHYEDHGFTVVGDADDEADAGTDTAGRE